MFVCLYVCMFFMHFDTVRASASKLSRDHPLIQEKVKDYFLSKKIDLPPSKGLPVYLTNQIAAFNSIEKLLNSTF